MCRNCAQMYAKWDKPQSTIHFTVATQRDREFYCVLLQTKAHASLASEREKEKHTERERERERKREIYKMGKGKRHVQNEKRSERKKTTENFLIKLSVEDCTKYIK